MRKELFEIMIDVVEHYQSANECIERESNCFDNNDKEGAENAQEEAQEHWEKYDARLEYFIKEFIRIYENALEDYDGSSRPKGIPDYEDPMCKPIDDE